MKARFVCAAAAVLFAVAAHAAHGDPNGPGLPARPQLREKAPAYLAFTPSDPEQAWNLRQQICPLLTAGSCSLARSHESAPQPPLASQPDVCDVSSNPMDVLLCKSAAAANRSPARPEAP